MTKLISISHLASTLSDKYVLASLAHIWRDQKFRVDLSHAYAPDADLCILHHDLTRLDAAALPPPPNGVRALNASVLDISKRRYSSLLLKHDDAWAGPVIIKTNLNHFGAPEVRAGERRRVASALRERLARISWRLARALPKRVYPVLPSQREVPDWVWRDPDLIVERFLPERASDGLFCIRGWLFFGDRGYGYRLFSTDPLVKTGTMVRYEYIDNTPPRLTVLREEMGFDFGKFDYVEHEGEPILLDANKTPSFSGDARSPRLLNLAQGVEAFL